MKNLLLLLLLANILYFLWNLLVEERPERGVAVIEESELGPPLDVTRAKDPDAVTIDAVASTAVPSSDEPDELADATSPAPADLTAIVGRSCVTVGPFQKRVDADAAQMLLAKDGISAVLRSQTGEIFVGHWVQIRNIADRASADAALDTLHEGGLGDAYTVVTEEEGIKISLGLFGDIERAERVELQARSMGFAAEIAPRSTEGQLTFVDAALPPGRGAGAIVDRYGEERVRLRGAATCPP